MPDEDGWLILSRRLFEGDLWKDSGPFDPRSALVDLIQRAAHSEHVRQYQGRPVYLQPGDFLASSRTLAKRWGWSQSKTARYLAELCERGTLKQRPAWDRGDSAKIPPTVYTFPKYLEHQRRMTQEHDSREALETVGSSHDSRLKSMTQGIMARLKSMTQETAKRENEIPETLTQEHDSGNAPGDSREAQAREQDSGAADSGAKRRELPEKQEESKAVRTYPYALGIGIFPELEAVPDGDLFATVDALAKIATRYGQDPAQRGLAVKLVLERVRRGVRPLDIAHAFRGTRALAERGELPHIAPGSTFSAAAVFGTAMVDNARPIFSAAADLSPTLDTVSHDPPQH